MGTIGVLEPENFKQKSFSGVSAYGLDDFNNISGPISGEARFPSPDRLNMKPVLLEEGEWEATDNGYVIQLTGVTHSSTVYIKFSMTINGIPELIEERIGLLSTGLYNWQSQPSIVRAGDIIKISHDGGGTGTVTNQLAFMPVKY